MELELLKIFQNGYKLKSEIDGTIFNVEINNFEIGELILTSGKIVACDPVWLEPSEPFTVQIPPGRYPVILSVATAYENLDRRVAGAMLKFSDKPPVNWELALVEGQDLKDLGPEEFFGYSVEGGAGSFMNLDVTPILAEQIEEWVDKTDPKNYLAVEAVINDILDHHWARVELNSKTGANIIAFSSGFGDGAYPSYFGYAEDGVLCCLVTDFFVLRFYESTNNV